MLISSAASAAEPYIGISAGVGVAHKSKENGSITTDIVAAEGNGAIPSGTSLGLETRNNAGLALSGTAGVRFENGLRFEAELSYTQNDVKSHSNLAVGGTVVDGAPVSVLTRSAATPTTSTIGAVINNGGDGRVNRIGAFANAFYDFNRQGEIQPYLGAGIGFQNVDVRYIPSGVPVADSSKTVFAYQVIAGVTAKISKRLELFGQYNYRGASRARVPLELLPARLGVESKQSIFSAGVRIPLG